MKIKNLCLYLGSKQARKILDGLFKFFKCPYCCLMTGENFFPNRLCPIQFSILSKSGTIFDIFVHCEPMQIDGVTFLQHSRYELNQQPNKYPSTNFWVLALCQKMGLNMDFLHFLPNIYTYHLINAILVSKEQLHKPKFAL